MSTILLAIVQSLCDRPDVDGHIDRRADGDDVALRFYPDVRTNAHDRHGGSLCGWASRSPERGIGNG